MVNDQLLSYVQQARQSGVDDVKIREDLLKNGWTDLDINEALGQNITDKPRHASRLWLKTLLVIIGLLVVGLGLVAVKYYMEQRAIVNLENNGSIEYKQYIESINKISEPVVALEAEMKALGSSAEDIEVAKRDYIDFLISTLRLQIQLEESSLTDIEKKDILQRLQTLEIENKSTLTVDSGCDFTEQELSLQDFFVGTTLKFKKPMVYIDWKEEQEKYCSPSFAAAQYYSLESISQWDSTVFDKEGRGIKEYKIDPSLTFTVEGRIKLHSRSLFGGGDIDHYVLKDSNGVISVVPFLYIFDYKGKTADDGKTGSELYKDGKLVGHVVSDLMSGEVWIQGAEVPKEVIEVN